MIVNLIILGLVTLERLFELLLARRNTARLVASGAREHSPGHYPFIVALHFLWLATLWVLAPRQPIERFWLFLFLVVELGRIWVLVTLGARWTTRIIVLPDAPLIRRGPYRYLNHPNYWVVVFEIAVLPLAFHLWPVALIFTLINGALLGIRVRQENRALGR